MTFATKKITPPGFPTKSLTPSELELSVLIMQDNVLFSGENRWQKFHTGPASSGRDKYHL